MSKAGYTGSDHLNIKNLHLTATNTSHRITILQLI